MEETFYQAGITTLPLSNVIPFFFTHITRNLKWLSHRSLGDAGRRRSTCLIFQRGLQKSWPERKILWSSAKYCGASQKDYRCAEYCGAVQHVIKKCKILEQCLETRNKIQSIKAPSNATPTLLCATILTSPRTTKQRTIYTLILLKTNFSSFVIFLYQSSKTLAWGWFRQK